MIHHLPYECHVRFDMDELKKQRRIIADICARAWVGDGFQYKESELDSMNGLAQMIDYLINEANICED